MISNIVRNYNRKEDKVKPYLEFRSSTPMTITPNYTNSGITLQYSLDTVTWTNISAKAVTPSANVIYFRGSATGTKTLYTSTTYINAWLFTNANNLEVNGDITMLIQDTLGNVVVDIPLANYCYDSMLRGCTSLTTAPALPATTLANYCYNSMFYGCTRLTTAPALPATTLASGCYNRMFYGCTSLTTTPELPATTLANFCYASMFFNCSSLTTAPELPATTLATNCYSNMFYNCSSLKFSLTKNGEYQKEYRIPKTGTINNDPSNWNTDMFNMTGGTFKGNPTINTIYYTI